MRHALENARTVVRSTRAAGAAASLVCAVLTALPFCAATATAQMPTSSRSGAPLSGTTMLARHREAFYVAGAASGVAANAIWRYHPGSRVGEDVWLGRDKALHGGTASSLTLAGIRAGVRPWVAATTVCAAGGAFELTQLRASGKDATVNCAGAATVWAGTALLRHWRAGR